MFISKIPIVICVEQVAKDLENRRMGQISFLFSPTLKGYQRMIPTLDEMRKPAFVLQGYMQKTSKSFSDEIEEHREFLKHDLGDLYLMNSADHRQCMDASKGKLVQEMGGKRLASYQERAVKEGCSLDNPSLFFINHAFCASLASLCGSIIKQGSLKRNVELLSSLETYKLSSAITKTILEYEDEI